jgi:sodium/potassium-transporting ATPase subunit alpha
MQTLGAAKGSKSKSMSDAVSNTEKIRTWKEHTWPNDKLVQDLNTNAETGLTTEQATLMIAEHGRNVLSDKDTVAWYIVFLKEMTGFFSLLLWFGSILCFFGYSLEKSED